MPVGEELTRVVRRDNVRLSFSAVDGALVRIGRVDSPNEWARHGERTTVVDARLKGRGWVSILFQAELIDIDENGSQVTVVVRCGPILLEDIYVVDGGLIERRVRVTNEGAEEARLEKVLLAVPWVRIGEVSDCLFEGPGNTTRPRLPLGVAAEQRAGGPIAIVVPDISAVTPILTVDDPAGDDHGLGSYTYPSDGVFETGCYDLKQFVAGYDERNLVFAFYLNGSISNPWGSSSGLAVQSLDVYIDVDHEAGSGSRILLPGRNLAVSEKDAWDYAIWAEGWTPGVFKVDANGKPIKLSATMKVIVDPVAQKVTIRVPKTAVPEGDPVTWGYLATVSSQDGFPSTGVWRLRDVEEVAVQWRLGGAPADTNHTRVIDLAWPEGKAPTQEEMLSDYPASQEKNMDKLSPDDFAQVGMLRVP